MPSIKDVCRMRTSCRGQHSQDNHNFLMNTCLLNSFVCHYITSGKPSEKLPSANPKQQYQNVLFVIRRQYLKQKIAKIKLLPHSTACEFFFVCFKALSCCFWSLLWKQSEIQKIKCRINILWHSMVVSQVIAVKCCHRWQRMIIKHKIGISY